MCIKHLTDNRVLKWIIIIIINIIIIIIIVLMEALELVCFF